MALTPEDRRLVEELIRSNIHPFLRVSRISKVPPADAQILQWDDDSGKLSFQDPAAVGSVPDHDHTGDSGDGGQISHDSSLTGVSSDDHHAESHTHDSHTGTLSISEGGTGQTTQQAAIDALTAVSGATNEHVLTKDTSTGNAIFKAAAGGGGKHTHRWHMPGLLSASQGILDWSYSSSSTETITRIVAWLGTAAGTSMTVLIQKADSDNPDAGSLTWTTLDTLSFTTDLAVIETSFTVSTIATNLPIRVNISAISGGLASDLTVVMRTTS